MSSHRTNCIKYNCLDFVPYIELHYGISDPLRWNVAKSLWAFPPSADKLVDGPPETVSLPSDRPNYGDLPISPKEQELLINFEEILGQTNTSYDEEQLKSWIQGCRSSNVNLDINRIARYAVRYDKTDAVRYLVDHEEADLTKQDILGRSAIFYAMGYHGLQNQSTDISLLQYISVKISDQIKDESQVQDLLNQTDTYNGRTALHYAVENMNLTGAELLLAKKADPAIRDKQQKKPIDLLEQDSFLPEYNLQMKLIFDLNRLLLQMWEQYTFGVAESPWRQYTFGVAESPWLCVRYHLPRIQADLSSPGSSFTSRSSNTPTLDETNAALLRRLGRDWNYPTMAMEALSHCLQASPSMTDSDLINREPGYLSDFDRASDTKHRHCSIVFPCLALRTKKSQKESRDKTKASKQEITDDIFRKLVQCERTIDETYFPSLSAETLRLRNEKQVVSRETGKVTGEGQSSDDRVLMLMVPQLWIWRVDHLVLTAFSSVSPGDLTDNELEHISDTAENQPDILVGLIIADQISQFGQRQINGEFPSPLDIFESNIVGLLSEVEAYADPSVESQLEMIKEQKFLFEIADIQEELAMIEDILNQQLDILDRLIMDTRNVLLVYQQKWEEVRLSKTKIETYQKRVKKLSEDAKRISGRIQDQLNLKRTHASIREAHYSRVLGTAVIGFTVITIIFAPLSFMTSLFDLPIDVLLENQIEVDRSSRANPADDSQPTVAYSAAYVRKWFAVAELVSLVVTVLVVWSSLWAFGDNQIFAKWKGEFSGKLTGARRSKREGKQETAISEQKDESESRPEKRKFRKRITNLWHRGGSAEENLESGGNAPLQQNPTGEQNASAPGSLHR
ncbi:hypothetical protein GGR54DRAFT_458835 [Hypoxylon sp. NC1633]|nr:hypothetical protein GGR54DRAFT_458835 [Hypoxylon sp. NC1633]